MLYDVTLSVLQLPDVGLTVPQWPVANAQSSNAVLKARPFIRRERETLRRHIFPATFLTLSTFSVVHRFKDASGRPANGARRLRTMMTPINAQAILLLTASGAISPNNPLWWNVT